MFIHAIAAKVMVDDAHGGVEGLLGDWFVFYAC